MALVLGENAQLEGSVVAEDVVVRGRLIGSVRALRVTLESKSHDQLRVGLGVTSMDVHGISGRLPSEMDG